MRVLYMGIGETPTSRALPQSWPDRFFGKEIGRHQVVTFGYAPGLDIQMEPGADFQAVLDALPPGFTPDVCVCTHVDYLLIPRGIEHAPFPTVAITADWDFRIGIARTVAETFDLTVTLGEESCQAMHALGARHTLPFAYFGVPEQEFEAPLAKADCERPIDVLFTGTINDYTHLDRSQWLARVAGLSNRFNVIIGQPDASPSAYRKLLQQSKLVFTFHRRGELQMRFTDAVTQGAAVLDNGRETARYFQAGTEYLHYDEANLEELIGHYVTDHAARSSVVDAARRRTIAEFGSVHRFEQLFDRLEVEVATRSFGPRTAQLRSESEQGARIAEQLFTSHYDTCMAADPRYLELAATLTRQSADSPRQRGNLAVILDAQASGDRVATRVGKRGTGAIEVLENLLADQPNYAIGHFQMGCVKRSHGELAQASQHFERAQDALQSKSADFDPWAIQPRRRDLQYRSLLKSYNDALFEACCSGDDTAPRQVLAAESAHARAGLCRLAGDLIDANAHATEARQLDPTRAEFSQHLASTADVLGFVDQAHASYESSIALAPFLIECRIEALQFWSRTGQHVRARQVLEETIALCRAVPQNDHMIERIRLLVGHLAAAVKGQPIKGELIRDHYCLASITELCEHLEHKYDDRLHRRIGELLRLSGKDQAADDWDRQRIEPAATSSTAHAVPALH